MINASDHCSKKLSFTFCRLAECVNYDKFRDPTTGQWIWFTNTAAFFSNFMTYNYSPDLLVLCRFIFRHTGFE